MENYDNNISHDLYEEYYKAYDAAVEQYKVLVQNMQLSPYHEIMLNLELDKNNLIHFMVAHDYDIYDNNNWIFALKYVILDDIFMDILNKFEDNLLMNILDKQDNDEDIFNPITGETEYITELSNNIRIYLQNNNADLNKIIELSDVFNPIYKDRNEIERRLYNAALEVGKPMIKNDVDVDGIKRYKRAVERYNELQSDPHVQQYFKIMSIESYPDIDKDLINIVTDDPKYDIENDNDWIIAAQYLTILELLDNMASDYGYDNLKDKERDYLENFEGHIEDYLRDGNADLNRIIELSDVFNLQRATSYRDIEKRFYDAACKVAKTAKPHPKLEWK